MSESKRRPLSEMIGYMGQKIETHEIVYSMPAPEGGRLWRSEFAQREASLMTEIFKTLTLVATYEREFKGILKRKMAPRNGNHR